MAGGSCKTLINNMPENNNDYEKDMGGFWNKLLGFFEAAFKSTWTGFVPALGDLGKVNYEHFKATFTGKSVLNWTAMLAEFKRKGWIDDETSAELLKLNDLDFPMDMIAYYAVGVLLTFKHTTNWSEVISADVRRKLFAQHRPVDVSADSIIPAAFLAPEKIAQVKEIMKQTGLPDEQIELLFLSFNRPYDEATIQALFWRGVLTEDEVYKNLRALAYTDERIKKLLLSWPRLPSVSDIIHYLAKEVFEPEMIETFGLDEGYPTIAEEHAARQGVAPEWVKAEWLSHWRDLGMDFMLEAFHRHIVDWDLVYKYMGLIEIPPKLREIVRDTAFRVFTRVDVRRMHSIGVLTEDELVSAYQDQGYDDVKATKMAQFTVQYNLSHEKDLTKAEILNGFSEAIIKREDAKPMLIAMKYSEDEADYLLNYEQYKKDKKLEDMKLNNIGKLYQNNIIPETEMRNRLGKLNLSADRMVLLVEQWDVGKLKDIKVPSKADQLKFLKTGLITTDQCYQELLKLGYNDRNARLYLASAAAAEEET